MSGDTPAHDFLLPRLAALVREAEAQGIEREVAVAVLTDLITGPQFNDAVPDPAADSTPRPAGDPEDGVAADAALEQKHALIEQVAAPRGII